MFNKTRTLVKKLFFGMLLVAASMPASAGYILGNSYYLMTEATTESDFKSCAVKPVSSYSYCERYDSGYTTTTTWCAYSTTSGGGSATSCGASSSSEAYGNCQKGPGWSCSVYSQVSSVPYSYCASYGTGYTMGACMTDTQARSAGLGSYIDAQLATYNQAPLAQPLTLTLDQDYSGSVTLMASDADGTVAGYAIHTQSPHGSAVITGTQLTFTPNPGWFGTTSVLYRAQDDKGAWSAAVSVDITVIANIAPVAEPLELTTSASSPASLMLQATDADGPRPTVFELVSLSPYGTSSIHGSTLTFIPNTDWNGDTTLTYRAKDDRGGWSTPAPVSITVSPMVKTKNAYYLVVGSEGRFAAQAIKDAAIHLDLDDQTFPTAYDGIPYGINLNPALRISGDLSFTGTGVRWSVEGGAVPPGLELATNGILSGTPRIANEGSFTFTAAAKYKTRLVKREYTIEVAR